MAAAPGIPQNFNVQSANQKILVSWSLVSGATSYIITRSLDNITFDALVTLSGSPLATSYVDTAVTLQAQYFYKVAAANGVGTGISTQAKSEIPVPTGEMALAQIRLKSQQRADRVNSNFVTLSEWNSYINQAMFELYDLLITVYEDYYIADPIQIIPNGSTFDYTLPNGTLEFVNPITGQSSVAKPFYKLSGVDLTVNTAQNQYYTVNKFNWIDRNRNVLPNTNSVTFGYVNTQYRVMGNKISFIPTPAGSQAIRIWYVPRLTELLQDTDTSDIGISGWIEYVIVRAAKYALDKEESDTSKLDQQILFLKARIEETAANRDQGQPDTISNTRRPSGQGGWGNDGGGSMGGAY